MVAATTNFIGQKTLKTSPDVCERSCEEVGGLFQELKGLRIVVGNLIDRRPAESGESPAGRSVCSTRPGQTLFSMELV